METKINIAEILRNKPHGVKLYSPIFGECEFCYVSKDTNEICVKKHNGLKDIFDSKGLYYNTGEVMLFPSREMHDWFKLDWKRGDALFCGVDNLCIFEKWANKEYTEFYAKFVTPNYSGNTFKTEKWSKETNEAVIKQYISNIEEFKGGKLNLTTLEIEKTQPEFKDGDIVALVVRKCTHIAIFQSRQEAYIGFHAVLCQNDELLLEKPFREDVGDIELRLATDSEKQQLFEALAKKGKRWNPNTKQIEDLPKKYEFKPFDKVLVRDYLEDKWMPNFFSCYDGTSEYKYGCIAGNSDNVVFSKYCIPYNEETAKLIGTTNNWRG